jgi:hypothetical protein
MRHGIETVIVGDVLNFGARNRAGKNGFEGFGRVEGTIGWLWLWWRRRRWR